MFKELNWLSVYQRCVLNRCILMYKIANSQAPGYLVSHFSQASNISDYNLRSVNDVNFILQLPHSDFYRRSISYAGAFQWNKLPDSMKGAQILDMFKYECKKLIGQEFPLNKYCI